MNETTRGAVIVTGGGYGIGRAAAELLASDGWATVIVDRDAGRVAETCRRIHEAGGVAVACAGDVTHAETAARAVDAARETDRPLAGLVTCAAMRHAGPITEITETQWDETVNVVLKGVFLFCKAAIEEMRRQRSGGTIVNVSSPDSFGRKGMVAYASAKAAVNTLSACLAADHLADGIRVNVIQPGLTLTGMTEHYGADRMADAAGRSVAGRVAMPADLAEMIRFLFSPAMETFTGGSFGMQPLATR